MGDPYFGSVSSSLHLNGVNDGTSFPDSSISARSWTRQGSTPPVTKTGEKKFGTASYYSDGNGWIETTHTSDLTLEGDFTIDGWYYCTDTSDYRTVFCAHGTTHSIDARVHGGNLTLIVDGSAAISIATTLNTWHHFEVNRSGSTISMAHDGTFSGTTYTQSGTFFDGSTALHLGHNSTLGRTFAGYIDDFRFTKGVVRNTSNFSVPASENDDFIGVDVALTLPVLTSSITAILPNPITIAMVAGVMTSSIDIYQAPFEISIEGEIPAATGLISALLGGTGEIESTLPLMETFIFCESNKVEVVIPSMEADIVGHAGILVNLTSQLPRFDADISGEASLIATVSMLMPQIEVSIIGALGVVGTFNMKIPQSKGSLSGLLGSSGVIGVDLPKLEFDLDGAQGGFASINMMIKSPEMFALGRKVV